MSSYQIALLIACLVVALSCKVIPHARAWVITMFFSFILSVIWQRTNMPYPAYFNLVLDVSFCIALNILATENWELKLHRLFQGSVLISLLRLCGGIPSNTTYVISLELINWAALLLITFTTIFNRIYDGNDHNYNRSFSFYNAYLSLRKIRAKDCFLSRSTKQKKR